jgi:hypothetical protein
MDAKGRSGRFKRRLFAPEQIRKIRRHGGYEPLDTKRKECHESPLLLDQPVRLDAMTEIDDYACRPNSDIYPETIEHWAAWLTVGMILILQADDLDGAQEIAAVRLREATDPIYGLKAFSADMVADWRSHYHRREDRRKRV